VRAAASACAANRIAVLVPCHRVLRGDGGFGGYRWGLAQTRSDRRGAQPQLSPLTGTRVRPCRRRCARRRRGRGARPT
jgi:hypothetical protein